MIFIDSGNLYHALKSIAGSARIDCVDLVNAPVGPSRELLIVKDPGKHAKLAHPRSARPANVLLDASMFLWICSQKNT